MIISILQCEEKLILNECEYLKIMLTTFFTDISTTLFNVFTKYIIPPVNAI